MKVLVKWKKSVFFVLLLVMAVTIYITIGSQTDEKSKFGHTSYQSSGAVTHIKSINVNVNTPKNFVRFFQDSSNAMIASYLKKHEIIFLAASKDYSTIQEYYTPEADSGLSDSDYEKLIEQTQYDYKITGGFEHADITIGNNEFHRVCYPRQDGVYLDHGVVAEYFIEHDGQLLQLRSYTEFNYDQEPVFEDTIDDVCEEAEENLAYLTYGSSYSVEEAKDSLMDRFKSLTFAPWVLLLPFIYAFLCGLTYMGYSEKLYDPDRRRYRFISDEGTGWNDDFLSLDTSKMLLGFFSVLIVFHHLVQQTGKQDAGMLVILEDFGVGFVGTFFFFSGFGLYESFKTKKDYLKGFLKKRLPSVLIPFYSINLIFFLFELAHNDKADTKQLILWLTGWNLLNTHMWYIVEIAVLYIIFYLIFRYIKNRRSGIGLLFVCIALLITGSFFLGHGDAPFQGEWWYNTTILFPLGVLFSEFKDDITYFMKRFYHILTALAFAAFVELYRVTAYMLKNYGYWTETALNKAYDDKFRTFAVQCPMVMVFVLLLLLLGMKLKIGNRFLAFLGSISLELYLIHGFFFPVFSDVTGTGAFFVCVLAASIPAAYLLHFGFTCIFCLMGGRPLPDIRAPFLAIPGYFEAKTEGLKQSCEHVKSSLTFASRHKSTTVKMIFRYIFCTALCIISLLPIALLFINSTKSTHDILQGISFLPGGKFAENLQAAKGYLSDSGLKLYEVVGLSCAISITTALVGTYIGGLCAYGFEYYKFMHKKVLWWVVISALMIPATAGCVGFLKLVIKLNLYNNILPIILAGITIPSCAYFLRMYLHTLKLHEIIEAARIDGCPEFIIFNRIILPIMKPAIFLQLIINFAYSWNNTLYQNYILIDIHKKSLSVFLKTMVGMGSGMDPVTYMLLLISTVPSLVILVFLSRGLTAHINLGAVKE